MSMSTTFETTEEVRRAGLVFTQPDAYADEARFHAACTLLRAEAPVHRVEAEGFRPFWAVTKHADIMEIEGQPQRFTNAPISILGPAAAEVAGSPFRTLINMDAPDHKHFRALTADWFMPASVRRLDDRMATLAKASVDKMAQLGGTCDFAQDVAVHYPLQVILSILGLPESDFARMLTLTQEMFGAEDPDLARGGDPANLLLTLQEFFQYFQALTADRRATPTDDLASIIANGVIDGEPLNDFDTFGYYLIIATAGHDTTSSAIAGGFAALVEHPDQLALLKTDPSLIGSAVDEMIRWTTPVKQFLRNAQEPYVLRGRQIEVGDRLLLSYPSANRDEDVFHDPFCFDVTRKPNKQIAFGFGVHHCLGAILARMEMKALLTELLPRLDDVQLAGTVAHSRTLFVGGVKRLPVSYRMT